MRRSTSIDALIRLIDDPDLTVFEQVRLEILKNGQEAIPRLYDLLDNLEDLGEDQIRRIESLVKELHFNTVMEALEKWCMTSQKDLMQGLQIISSYQFPDVTLQLLESKIQTVQRRIWLEVNRRMTAFENVERMNTMWFDNIGMQVITGKNTNQFHTFINTVLDDLCGTALSVGLLYSIIGQRLNLPIYGVNFPGQFVLAYIDEFRIHRLIEPLGTGGVLFYVMLDDQGKVVIRKHLEDRLNMQKICPLREYFEPCSHSSLLILYLDELIEVFDKLERQKDVQVYQAFKNRILELA